MARNTVAIRKGDLSGEVLPSALPLWQKNGWTAVDDGSSEPDSPETDQVDLDQFSLLDSEDKE